MKKQKNSKFKNSQKDLKTYRDAVQKVKTIFVTKLGLKSSVKVCLV